MGVPLQLYFVVTERAISSVLVQEQDQMQKAIYFVSKVLQGPETRYQALEKAALAAVFSARRLRYYFQSFTVVVMSSRRELQAPRLSWCLDTSRESGGDASSKLGTKCADRLDG